MKRLALAISLATLFVSAPAMADTMRVDGWQFANESSIAFNIKTASGTEATYAGEFKGLMNGQSFLTYCVDLLQTFAWGTTYDNFSLVSPGASQLPWLTSAKANDLGRLFTGFADSVTDYVTSSALQLVTWAIVTETGGSYSVKGNGLVATPYFSGTTTQENLAITTAETWLHSLPGYSNYAINVAYSPSQQDLIVATRLAADQGHVPEPATYVLLAGSLGLLAASRRRQTVRALA
jgi:hypothetical protein